MLQQTVFCRRLCKSVLQSECHELVLGTQSNLDLISCRQCAYGKFLRNSCPIPAGPVEAERPDTAFTTYRFADILLDWHRKYAWAKTCNASSLVNIAARSFRLQITEKDIELMTKKSGLNFQAKNSCFFILYDSICKTFIKKYYLFK